jgi:hypothetical protein
MKTVTEYIFQWIERFNRLIKLQLKIDSGDSIGETKINFTSELPDFEAFKSEIKTILKAGRYSDDFINLLNRLYFISESNSDLLIGNSVLKTLTKEYPIVGDLEKLSFAVYEFIRNFIFFPDNEIVDDGFSFDGSEWLKEDVPEYLFKDGKYILWSLYYLIHSLTEDYLTQELKDSKNQLDFIERENVTNFINQEQKNRLAQITISSKDLCDRNLPFLFLKDNPIINKANLFYLIISDMLEKLPIEDYSQYVEFEYAKYNANFRWHFEKKSPEDYKDLSGLPKFNCLVQLLCNILYVKAIENEKTTIQTPVEPVLESADYVLDVTLLGKIYSEFNGELWFDIPVRDFLNMFTTAIQLDEKFKVLQKERFYYLLKKIWLNGEHRKYFNTEKDWIEPFLKNYKLSVSGYWNQSVHKGGQFKHRSFTSTVDKILPLTELF